MANLKEIRNRITSVNSTKQITSAMKMVSASKLRKAQDRIIQMRPYANKLKETISQLSGSVEDISDNPYLRQGNDERILLILITSNRGLCGGFNANIIKEANKLLNGKYKTQNLKGNVSLYCIGKKGSDFFNKRHPNIYKVNNSIFDNLSWENVLEISNEILNDFEKGVFDRVEIIFNEFKNAAVQILTVENFLPVEVKPSNVEESNNFYIFEPSKDEIMNGLIPKQLRIQLYKSLLDSNAAEQGARMTAMHKATDNATELVKELKLIFNKERQSAITKEILEIVGGAQALNN